MRIFFYLSLSYLFLTPLGLPEKLAPLTNELQQKCASAFPPTMTSRVLAQSFLCGLKISDPKARETFRRTGLLHLMVVSGGHLQILSLFILMPWPRSWRKRKPLLSVLWSFLILYCLTTGFQPPLVRAFCGRIVSYASKYFRLHWDQGKVQLFSGLLVLIWIPEWILSFSFYLSWLAALGFLVSPLGPFSQRKYSFLKSWLNCFFIQGLVAVGLSQFSILGLIVNCLFAPLIALILFPLSGIVLIFPFLVPVADGGWQLILQFLEMASRFSESAPPTFFGIPTSRWILLWFFLAATHCFFEVLRQTRYRKHHV